MKLDRTSQDEQAQGRKSPFFLSRDVSGHRQGKQSRYFPNIFTISLHKMSSDGLWEDRDVRFDISPK